MTEDKKQAISEAVAALARALDGSGAHCDVGVRVHVVQCLEEPQPRFIHEIRVTTTHTEQIC